MLSKPFRQTTYALIAALCLLAGCAAPTPRVATSPPVVEAAVQGPEDLIAQARLQRGDQADELRLRAAELWLEANDILAADRAVKPIRWEALSQGLRPRFARLQFAFALFDEDLERAGGWLPLAELHGAAAADARANLCALAQQFACAAEELMRAAALSDAPAALSDRIWTYLAEAARRQQPRIAAADHTAQGWWALLDIATSAAPIAAQQSAYASWQRAYAGHPAHLAPPAGLSYLTTAWSAPTQIAALLPLSGPLAAAGATLRDALIAAHLLDPDPAKAALRFYDTASAPITEVYERALAGGAELMIGPLIKRNVATLANSFTEVPVVALNRIDAQAPTDNLLQLSLAIEDEAETVVERLQRDGHERILAVVSQEAAWAGRALAVLESGQFARLELAEAGDATSMTQAIGDAMRVTASSRRQQQIAALIGEPVEFQPRPRTDLDAVVAFVDGVQAQALAPALRYHFADGMPVYVGAQALRGNASPRTLQDMHVTDLPMLISPTGVGQALVEAYALTPNATNGLYALGADAYVVANRFPVLQTAGNAVRGYSGLLRVDEQGLLSRRQSWATIDQGRLVAETP